MPLTAALVILTENIKKYIKCLLKHSINFVVWRTLIAAFDDSVFQNNINWIQNFEKVIIFFNRYKLTFGKKHGR